MGHEELVERAGVWLKKSCGCSTVATEIRSATDTGEIPDAIGWRSDYSVLVECKTSRADFLADANKPFRQMPDTGMGSFRFYLCPPELIYPEDVPDHWGLLYADEGHRITRILGPKGNIWMLDKNRERFLFQRTWGLKVIRAGSPWPERIWQMSLLISDIRQTLVIPPFLCTVNLVNLYVITKLRSRDVPRKSPRTPSRKPRIYVSTSGGRTSMFMARMIQERYAKTHDLTFMFANTGQEHEETLRFLDRCDRAWGLNLVWLEAVTHYGERKGCTHRHVTFETASRKGEPFEDAIKKYGIPNKAYPMCTRELKTNVMDSYRREDQFDKATDRVAVGIRADEIDRMSVKAKKNCIWYPLIKWGVTKPAINTWWAQQPFNLNLKEHQGNCVWCWKKSLRKHLTLITENPEFFDFPRRMEQLYPDAGHGDGGRVFFREKRSTEDLFRLAQEPFEPFREELQLGFLASDLDVPNGADCSESCEAYGASYSPDNEMLYTAV